MAAAPGTGLKLLVFSLVASTFMAIYVPQPVLPVLREEFGVSAQQASLAVSAVVLGIALSTLPWGRLADALAVRPLILAGGAVVAACGFLCAGTRSFPLLVALRFLQGLSIPAVTTGLIVHMVRRIPADRLNVVMGSYVSATVAGGLGGRLVGGGLHGPLHWRHAFAVVSGILACATLAAAFLLPRGESPEKPAGPAPGYRALLSRPDLRRVLFVAFGAFFVFSSVFNYMPFYLAGPPFFAGTGVVTLLYLSYLVGVAAGPLAGRLSDRLGNGAAIALGAAVFAGSVGLSLVPSTAAVAASLAGVCAGFFTVHSAAAGALNRLETESRGRANSLYVLFYYLGGSAGITLSGFAYGSSGWRGVAALGAAVLALILLAGSSMRRAGARGG